MKSGINKLAKVLTVSIDKEKVKVFTEKEDLLITNNNIQAYLRLYKALEGQEADIYALVHWGMNIASSIYKEDFLAILRRWFEN
nr:MAG: hypothetical protein [Bacteriophage sp.]